MTSTDHRPDVAAFVAEVRDRLADLPLEERDDLLDGLEADLAEQLADGQAGVLADPAAYAAELRAAAGLPSAPRRRVALRGGVDLDQELDELRARWTALVERTGAGRRAWSVVSALQPAWWVLRAWVAVTLLDVAAGTSEQITLAPTLGLPGLGLLVLLGAVALSVLLGQGRLWPAVRPGARATRRVVLVGLNLVAVVGLLGVLSQQADEARYGQDAFAPVATPTSRGVVVDGREVRNLYPYDAAGQPLTGVQLFDGAGRPVALSAEQASSADWGSTSRLVGCPWLNGSRRLYNVFPLPERLQRTGTCERDMNVEPPTAQPTPPLAQVPPVTAPAP